MDEAFTRYMYYERAKQGLKSFTTEALRKFYERDDHALLKKEETFENIIDLTDFWLDVETQNVDRFSDRNNRAITKAMLTWWAYKDDAQELPSLESALEIEHIFVRKRQENEKSLSDPRNLEALGNKVLLEKRINIREADYKFQDKIKCCLESENARKQIRSDRRRKTHCFRQQRKRLYQYGRS